MAKKDRPALALNSTTEIELANGDTVGLTLTWMLLMQLRRTNKDVYQTCSKAITGGVGSDIVMMIDVVYCAYLCWIIQSNGSTAGAMGKDEFFGLVPTDIQTVISAVNDLLGPKAKRDSENPS